MSCKEECSAGPDMGGDGLQPLGIKLCGDVETTGLGLHLPQNG